jgi:hypothetical protein
LFTPPDFLAECRRFIESSSKKKPAEEQEWQDPAVPEEGEHAKTLTFSNLLSDSLKPAQKATEMVQLGINEVISENASANISTKKPESEVQFQFKIPSIHSAE